MIDDYQTPVRMAAKLAAVPLPHLMGKSVLDVGTDMGYWAFLAASKGAARVLGLDRNREVRGVGHVDLVELNRRRAADEGRPNVGFEHINLGKQWREFGKFDVVFCLSMYHHFYENCGDHAAVWFWLSRHCKGQVLWEGPMDDTDPVVQRNVSDENRASFSREEILDAASQYFDAERIGPALHEPTREVWRFGPKVREIEMLSTEVVSGAGGATPAFLYDQGRRIDEIEYALGFKPYPGSLNLRLAEPFDFDSGYYRSQILDVVDRSAGLESKWAPRWARFYPLIIDGEQAWAFRFEGEKYATNFLELLAPIRLRDKVTTATIAR
jgi:2-polyprenyl-3-methyl-5-hydroxy-6-metoxy-1,4-benzoquinol methylase